MIRPVAVLAVFALALGATHAQEVPPAAPAAPAAAPKIVIDPSAALNTTPKQVNMLTGFYATQAVIELCSITLDAKITEGMTADQARLETALGMDTPSAAAAYAQVKADVAKTKPDCAEGSSDRAGVDAVADIYAALPPPAAAAAPAATPAPATPEAPAAPAAPAATPAPATPAAPAAPAQ